MLNGCGPWGATASCIRTFQPIANPLLCEDELGLLRYCFQFLPQCADVDAQVLNIGLGTPDLAQDEFVGEHLAGMRDQQAQQVVFARRELHLLTADSDDAADQVDGQIARLENGFLPLLLKAMPKRSSDAGQEFVGAEGLGDIVVGTEVESAYLAGFVGPSLKHHDGDGRSAPA